MNFFIPAIITLFLSSNLNAQYSKSSIELGAALLTLNYSPAERYLRSQKPRVEYLNCLFFRYNRPWLSLRALASYAKHCYEESFYASNTITNGYHSRDFRIGVGAQFVLFKNRRSIYIFTDALYRHVTCEGFSSTDRPLFKSTYYLESNGLDAYTGLGVTIKLLKHFYLSQELALNARYEYVTYSGDYVQLAIYGYNFFSISPTFRFSLCYKLPKSCF